MKSPPPHIFNEGISYIRVPIALSFSVHPKPLNGVGVCTSEGVFIFIGMVHNKVVKTVVL